MFFYKFNELYSLIVLYNRLILSMVFEFIKESNKVVEKNVNHQHVLSC